MKMKLALTLGIAAMAAQPFAATIDTDTSWPSGYTLTEKVTVTNDAALSFEGGVNTGNFGMQVDAGSSIVFTNNSGTAEFKTVSPSADTPNIFDIHGTVDKTGTGASVFILSDQSNQNTEFNLHDGSVFKSQSGVINFEVRRGVATVNIMKGATLSGSNDFLVGGRGDADPDGTLNVEGSATFGAWIKLGNSALNADRSGKAALNVTNGGYLKTRDFATNSGTGYDAAATIKDAGSQMVVSGAVTLNAANDARSTSLFTVYSGANFKVENANGLTSNSRSNVVFGLDSNIQAAAATAMFTISKFTVNTEDSAKTFSIDASNLGYVAGLNADDTVDVILADALQSITFNGTDYALSGLDDAALQSLLSGFMEFEFAGNAYWEAAGISDIRKSGNSLVLSMTYVPEPGAYAAIFGAAAMLLALRRRRG